MSYPPARYHGRTGEVSATFRPADQEPDVDIGGATTMSYLATGAGTDGGFGLYRWDAQPHALGPKPHFHRTMSESFFVLSGTVQLYDGRQWIDATAGDFLFVPEGGVHAFGNTSDEPASMLLLFAPGAPREGYFEGLARMAAGEEFTEQQRTEFLLKHDNLFL